MITPAAHEPFDSGSGLGVQGVGFLLQGSGSRFMVWSLGLEAEGLLHGRRISRTEQRSFLAL